MPQDIARRPLSAVNRTPVEPTYRRLVLAGAWLLRRLNRQEWFDQGKVPRTGGLIVVANHISNYDPPQIAHFLIWAGRWPRYLGKSDIWRIPGLGWLARQCRQIPVERNTERAGEALVKAEEALRAGECVVMYPEGTITADPGTWPMVARPGVARLAFRTGCPVIPIGQWGAHEVMPGKLLTWPRFLPRKTIRVKAGDPVELEDLAALGTPEAVREAGERITAALTGLVSDLRGVPAPPWRWDMRAGRRVPPGWAPERGE